MHLVDVQSDIASDGGDARPFLSAAGVVDVTTAHRGSTNRRRGVHAATRRSSTAATGRIPSWPPIGRALGDELLHSCLWTSTSASPSASTTHTSLPLRTVSARARLQPRRPGQAPRDLHTSAIAGQAVRSPVGVCRAWNFHCEERR